MRTLIALLLLLFAAPAFAGTAYTSTATGNWSAASTWSPSGVPGTDPTDTVTLGTGVVTLDTSPTVATLTGTNATSYITCGTTQTLGVTGSISYNSTNTTNGMIYVTAGALTVTCPTILNSGSGYCLRLQGGTLVVNGDVQSSAGSCIYNYNSTSVTISNSGAEALRSTGGYAYNNPSASGNTLTITGSCYATSGGMVANVASGGVTTMTLNGDLAVYGNGGNAYGFYVALSNVTLSVTGNITCTGNGTNGAYGIYLNQSGETATCKGMLVGAGATTKCYPIYGAAGTFNWSGTYSMAASSNLAIQQAGALNVSNLVLTIPGTSKLLLYQPSSFTQNANTKFILGYGAQIYACAPTSAAMSPNISWDLSTGGSIPANRILSGYNVGTLTLPDVAQVLTTAGSGGRWGVGGTGSAGLYNVTQIGSSNQLTTVSWGPSLSLSGSYNVAQLTSGSIGIGTYWGVGLSNSGSVAVGLGTANTQYVLSGHAGGTLKLPPVTQVQAGTTYGWGPSGQSMTGTLYFRRRD